jgi:hypothetical protein
VAHGVVAAGDAATLLETFCLEEGDGLRGPKLGRKAGGLYHLLG